MNGGENNSSFLVFMLFIFNQERATILVSSFVFGLLSVLKKDTLFLHFVSNFAKHVGLQGLRSNTWKISGC